MRRSILWAFSVLAIIAGLALAALGLGGCSWRIDHSGTSGDVWEFRCPAPRGPSTTQGGSEGEAPAPELGGSRGGDAP